jgi:hypothetical protein
MRKLNSHLLRCQLSAILKETYICNHQHAPSLIFEFEKKNFFEFCENEKSN